MILRRVPVYLAIFVSFRTEFEAEALKGYLDSYLRANYITKT